jgi:protein-disulfide isomerase
MLRSLKSLALASLVLGAPLSAQDSTLIKLADKGRVAGNAAATVWLVEVSDFQCPWCKKFHDETFATLKKEYVDSGKIRLAYLNLPLRMHPNAMPAAVAAMCASAQGKFWEMHDKIFDTQQQWEKLADPRAYLDSLAVASGAKAAPQKACSQSAATKALIEADMERARTSGVQSTPTFFVGGTKLEGAYPIADFRKVLDAAIAAAKLPAKKPTK